MDSNRTAPSHSSNPRRKEGSPCPQATKCPLTTPGSCHTRSLCNLPGWTQTDQSVPARRTRRETQTRITRRIQTTPKSIQRRRISTIPWTSDLGSCNRIEERRPEYDAWKDILPHSTGAKGIGRLHQGTHEKGIHSTVKESIRVPILFYKEERR